MIAAVCHARGIGGMTESDWLAFGGFVVFMVALVVAGAWGSSSKRDQDG